MIEWHWLRFDEFSLGDLYTVLAARQEIFTVEQNCPYQDADGKDQEALHLLGWVTDKENNKSLAAYLRVIPSGQDRQEVSIGRVITTKAFRGTGIGKVLLKEGVERSRRAYPNDDLYLSAQAHLQAFYAQFGFVPEGGLYDEDGIAHIAMYSRRSADSL